MKKSNRTVKNVIMILMIAALCVGSYFTMDYAKNHIEASSSSSEMQMPFGGMPGDFQSDSDSSNSSDSNSDSSNQPPEMPSGDSSDSSNQPPSPPDGGNFDSSNQPPDMPSGDNADSSNQPSEMPSAQNTDLELADESSQTDLTASETSKSGNKEKSSSSDSSDSSDSSSNSSSDSSGGFSKSDFKGMRSSAKKLTTVYYIVFAAESLMIAVLFIYLLMSRFNKKGFKETFKNSDKILIFILSTIIATSALTVADGAITDKFFLNSSSTSQQAASNHQGASSSVEASGSTTVDGKEETLESSYTSTESDESAILVTNGGNATITGATVEKSSGDSTNTENSEFYGVNSGILIQENSTATIKNATISTSAKGSNAVFSTGENSKIYISDSTITTTGSSSSRGLDATYGGYIEADNVTITTQGGSCAALATDRGEGTVIANNSTLETNGKGSPVIYSTGDISIDNTTGTANGSQNVVIEGKNSATVTNSTLKASGAGNRGDVDQAGVMIYQSMSGDASEGTGTFTAENSSLSIMNSSDYYKTAPMFFITNTDAVINLTNTKLSFGSGVLISAMGTDEWGNSGSNGGNVTLNATSQTLKGNITADSISTVSINLAKSSYEGTINADNSAKEISLTLDKDSTITLTGDSYVTSLDNADTSNGNINFNGYKLYVNGKAIN